ncbi:hypothetical protein Tco_0059563 [Tanacetum coccineum]
MNQLSVVRIEVFSMYGYNYMKKIILRQVDLKEYVIAERDLKYMYPSDFEDLYLLNLQGPLNHLSPDDKKLNLTKPRWDATGFEFKHDYTVIDSPMAVTFRDRYGSQQDKSRDEYKILDEERRCQKQGVHVRYPETAKDTTYLPKSGELYWVLVPNILARTGGDLTQETTPQVSVEVHRNDYKKEFTTTNEGTLHNKEIKKIYLSDDRQRKLEDHNKSKGTKLKSYLDTLERLGFLMPNELGVSLILNSLNKDHEKFVPNYNMHNIGKTIAELHAMIKLHEKGIPKKVATLAVLAIRGGKIQKDKKKLQGAKGKDKGKTKLAYAPKAKIFNRAPKKLTIKDSICHHYKEVGIFTIEIYSIPNKYWVYDTGYGTYIFNTTWGLRRRRKLKHVALNLYVGNGMRAVVEAIGSLDLILPNRRVIVLDNCHYAPSITRGVVSLSRLVDMHTFINYSISVMKDDVFYFNAILHDDDTQPSNDTSEQDDEVEPNEVDPHSVKVPIRRSERISQAPDRYGFYVDVEEHELRDLDEPPYYKAALSYPESNKWLDAMNAEMQSMKDNQVWCLVDLPPNDCRKLV